MKRKHFRYYEIEDRLKELEKRAQDPLEIAKLEINREEFQKNISPLYKLLEDNGIGIEKIEDLLRDRSLCKKAIPQLLEYFQLSDYIPVKSKILSILMNCGRNKQITKVLIEQFRNYANKGTYLGWDIAQTLSNTCTKDDIDIIIELIKNKNYGTDRQMLLLALAKMGYSEEKIFNALSEMLKDDDLLGQAVEALGILKNKKAVPLIEPFLNHEKEWIRNEAKKALKNITKK